MNTDSPWNLHYCEICRYGSKSAFLMGKHLKLHQMRPRTDTFQCDSQTPELFECELCEFSTNLKVDLTEHLRTIHKEKEGTVEIEDIFESHRCEKCDFKTHSLLVLANHQDHDCKKTILDGCSSAKRKLEEIENTDNSGREARAGKHRKISSCNSEASDKDNIKDGNKAVECTKSPTLERLGPEDQNSNKTLTATPSSSGNVTPCCCNASMLLSMYPEIVSSSVPAATTSGFYDKIMSMLLEIKEQNVQILEYIKRETRIAPPPVNYEDFPIDLPLNSQEALDELEFFLKDKKNMAKFSLYLSSLGGDSVVGRTNIILKRLVTNQLASNYNFYGQRSQKKPFCELSIKLAIVQAIQRGLPNASEKQVEDAIKTWLKHAPQRVK